MEEFMRNFENDPITFKFSNPNYVSHLHEIQEDYEKTGMEPNVAALATIGASLLGMSGALIEAMDQQNNEYEIVVSTALIGGILDTIAWINDRINLGEL